MSAVQRVVRDIRRVLQLGALPADLDGAAAAQEYAELCRDANQRLGQCMRHIEAGNLRAAMHVSEATPSLLDLCAALDFEGAERWRAFAAQNRWSIPPVIDAPSMQRINDAYSSALALEPLIRQLQLASFDRNHCESTRLLRRILRLDPATSHWADDLRAFEERRLQELEPAVAEAAAADDIARLVELQAELGEAWLAPRGRALLGQVSEALLRAREREASARGREIVALISQTYAAFDFDALGRALAAYRDLLVQGCFRPSSEMAVQFEEAHAWFLREADERGKERGFQDRLAELRAALDGGGAAGKELESLWRVLVNTGRPLPPDLERRVALTLESERIVEFRRRTRRVALGSLGAALALVLVLGAVAWLQYRRLLACYVPQLEQARARNDLKQLAELRDRIEQHLFLRRFLRTDPAIQQQLGQERDVASRVDGRKRELRELLARLDRIAKSGFGEDADFRSAQAAAAGILQDVAALREDSAYQAELDALAARRTQFFEDALLQKEKEIGDLVAGVTRLLPPFETVGARALPELQETARRLEAAVQAGGKAVAEYGALQKKAQLPGLSQAGVQSFEMAAREVRVFQDAVAARTALGRRIEEAPTLAAYYDALRAYAQLFAGRPRAQPLEAVLAARRHGELLVAPPAGMAEAAGTPRLEAVAEAVPADNYFWDALLQGVVDADKRAAQAWPEAQRAIGEWRADKQMVGLDEFDYAQDAILYHVLAHREFGGGPPTGTPTMRFLTGGRVYPPKRTDERAEFLETPPNVYRDVNVRNRRPMAHCVFLNQFTAGIAAAPPADAPALLLQGVLELRGRKDLLNGLLKLRLARLLTKDLALLLGPGTVPEVDAALKEMEAADDGSLDPLCFQNPIVQQASVRAEAVLQASFMDRAFLDRFRLRLALAREAIRRSIRWVGHADPDAPGKAVLQAGLHPQELWVLRPGAGAEMQLVVAAERQGVDYPPGEPLQPGEPLFAPLKDDAPPTRDALTRLLAEQHAERAALEAVAWPPVWPANRRR